MRRWGRGVMYFLQASLLENGLGCPRDLGKAFELYRTAATTGNGIAQNSLDI